MHFFDGTLWFCVVGKVKLHCLFFKVIVFLQKLVKLIEFTTKTWNNFFIQICYTRIYGNFDFSKTSTTKVWDNFCAWYDSRLSKIGKFKFEKQIK